MPRKIRRVKRGALSNIAYSGDKREYPPSKKHLVEAIRSQDPSLSRSMVEKYIPTEVFVDILVEHALNAPFEEILKNFTERRYLALSNKRQVKLDPEYLRFRDALVIRFKEELSRICRENDLSSEDELKEYIRNNYNVRFNYNFILGNQLSFFMNAE